MPSAPIIAASFPGARLPAFGYSRVHGTKLSVRPSFIKSQLNAAHRPLVSDLQPAFLRDPATWSHHERVVQYRVLAARYRRMAETEDRPFARDGLLELARECEAVAEQR